MFAYKYYTYIIIESTGDSRNDLFSHVMENSRTRPHTLSVISSTSVKALAPTAVVHTYVLFASDDVSPDGMRTLAATVTEPSRPTHCRTMRTLRGARRPNHPRHRLWPYRSLCSHLPTYLNPRELHPCKKSRGDLISRLAPRNSDVL